MGKSLFIVVAVCLMASGTYGQSTSMSCSTVNGKMVCEKQTNSGNTAQSSASAFSGPGGSSQDVYAGAGYPGGNWQSGQQRVVTGNGGNMPGNFPFPGPFPGFGFQGFPFPGR